MAIYRLNTQPIGRRGGRSVVACAAYRSGEKLEDMRYEKTHDYRRKQDVIYKEVLLPENAPEWMRDRSTLWNHIEEIEKRKDSRLAREVQIALPRELSEEQNRMLAREFVQKTFVNRGMVADVCIHEGKSKDGENQPHCHILLSTRHVDEKGFGQKNPEWNKKAELKEWRSAWAGLANTHLATHDHDMKIDHRSNRERRINLEPQRKVDRANTKYRDKQLENKQRIARENGERIYNRPEIALDALTKQQRTFSAEDLVKFVNRHSENAEQFNQVYERLKISEQLVKIGRDQLKRERFASKEMLALDTIVLKNARNLELDPQLKPLLNLYKRFEQNAPSYEQQMKVVLDEKYREEKEQFWLQANKFIAKFGASRPEVARKINESLVPEHETQAREYARQFKAYSYHEEKLKTKERKEFALLTKEMMQSKEIMNHLSTKEPELSLKIKQKFKEQERCLKYERSYSRGFGF